MNDRTMQSIVVERPIGEDFEAGLGAWDVMLVEDGDGVGLYDWCLVEDDGPGASGGDDRWEMAATDIVRAGRKVKKILHVMRPEAMSRHLSIYARVMEGETQPLGVIVNGGEVGGGQRVEVRPSGLKYQVVELDEGVIGQGDNEIVLTCEGDIGWRIYVATREAILLNAPERKDRTGRSFVSTDCGNSWGEKLGVEGDVNGEYQVRLSMKQYVERGKMIGQVVDLGEAVSGDGVGLSLDVKRLKLEYEAEIPAGAAVRFWVRSGDGPVVDGDWGEWIVCDRDEGVDGEVGRFVQWRVEMSSEQPTVTPVVRAVRICAEVEAERPSWVDGVKILDSYNPELRYTSMPFEYERFDEAGLVELREKYRLDKVVAGARSELEKMVKLRHWVSQQWEYDPPQPPYPAWDAREILERKQGFCVQYAIVYMQCALALGMQTRFVFGNFPATVVGGKDVAGHEVNEVWSNEYGKWVVMDAHQDECFIYRKTGIPLSMLDLHEESMRIYYGEEVLTYDGKEFDAVRRSPRVLCWKGDAERSSDEDAEIAVKWGFLRWLPRNNFMGKRRPVAMTQGINTWPYTGYWCWEDGQSPRRMHYGRYTSRRADIEWTINAVRFACAYGNADGVVEVLMGSVGVDVKGIEVRVDGGEWESCGGRYAWGLKDGENRIEMRVRARSGIVGGASYLELGYGGGG